MCLTMILCTIGIKKDKTDGLEFKRAVEEKRSRSKTLSAAERQSKLIKESAPTFSHYVYNKWKFAKIQLSTKHKYFGIILGYSPPRWWPQRVAFLATSLITILCIEALLYNYAYPDDPPGCASWTNQEACELPKKYWDTSSDRCLWSVEKQSCSFIEPKPYFVGSLVMSSLAILISSLPIMILALIFNSSVFPSISHNWGGTGDSFESDPEAFGRSEREDGFDDKDDDEDRGRDRSQSSGTKVRKRDAVKENLKDLINIAVITDQLKRIRRRRKVKRKLRETAQGIYVRVDLKMNSLRADEKRYLREIKEGAMDQRFDELKGEVTEV